MGVATLILTNPILNVGTTRAKLAAAVSKSRKELKQAVRQRIIKSIPTGRTYRRKGRSSISSRQAEHRASRRGQAPAIDSGKTLNSIDEKRTGDFSGEVSVNTEYAAILENKMDRPFVKTTADKYEKKFIANVEKALR